MRSAWPVPVWPFKERQNRSRIVWIISPLGTVGARAATEPRKREPCTQGGTRKRRSRQDRAGIPTEHPMIGILAAGPEPHPLAVDSRPRASSARRRLAQGAGSAGPPRPSRPRAGMVRAHGPDRPGRPGRAGRGQAWSEQAWSESVPRPPHRPTRDSEPAGAGRDAAARPRHTV